MTEGWAGLRHEIVKTRLALEAVLLYHAKGGPGGDEKLKWQVITNEMLGPRSKHPKLKGVLQWPMTATVLKLLVRKALAGSQEIR